MRRVLEVIDAASEWTGKISAFLLPGMMTLVAVFGAIFSSLSLIEDRNDGWLYAALASPAPRWAIATGVVVGGAAVAWGQGAVLLTLAPALDIHITISSALLALAGLAVTSVGLTAVGVAFAWRTETTLRRKPSRRRRSRQHAFARRERRTGLSRFAPILGSLPEQRQGRRRPL